METLLLKPTIKAIENQQALLRLYMERYSNDPIMKRLVLSRNALQI